MLTLRDALLLGLLPFLIAAVVAAWGWWLKEGVGWPAVLALAGGPLVGGLAHERVHFPPAEAFHWLLLLPAGALVVAFVARRLPPVGAALLVLLAGVGEAWLMRVPGAGSPPWPVILPGLAPGVLFVAIRPGARTCHVLSPTALLVISGATALVSLVSNSVVFGMYSLVLPATAAGFLAACLIGKNWAGPLGRGGTAAFLLVWAPVLFYGYLCLDVPWWRAALLAGSMLPLGLAALPAVQKLRPRVRWVLVLGAVCVIAAGAAVPAGRDLLQLMHSQQTGEGE